MKYMNLSIVDYFGYNLRPQERLRLIKEAGFSSVMLLWAGYFDKDYNLFPEYARNIGLQIENAHAPYLRANDLWKDSLDGQAAFDELVTCIKECAAHGIQTVVMHPENKSGTETVELPQDFFIGLDRTKRLVDIAERLDISIAVENMSGSRACSAFLVELDALMMVAPTIVPPCMIWPVSSIKRLIPSNMARPNWLSSSRWRKCISVVASGTCSVRKSIPTNLRRA